MILFKVRYFILVSNHNIKEINGGNFFEDAHHSVLFQERDDNKLKYHFDFQTLIFL